METKMDVGAVGALHPSKRLVRLSFIGCCLLLSVVPSLLQWTVIGNNHYHGSSSACMKQKSRIGLLVVSAFQLEQQSYLQPRRHVDIRNPRRFPSSRLPPLFVSFKDHHHVGSSCITNERRHRGTSHRMTQRQHYHQKFCRSNMGNPLFGGGSNDSDNESNGNNKKKRMFSFKRIGGRNRLEKRAQNDESAVEKTSTPSKTTKNKSRLPSAGFLVVALLVLTLLKNLLFGGFDGDGDSQYYYYSYSSSSVYETNINADGSFTTTETTRNEKSDLKTNIPGFTGNGLPIDRNSRSNGGGGSSSTQIFYFDE